MQKFRKAFFDGDEVNWFMVSWWATVAALVVGGGGLILYDGNSDDGYLCVGLGVMIAGLQKMISFEQNWMAFVSILYMGGLPLAVAQLLSYLVRGELIHS